MRSVLFIAVMLGLGACTQPKEPFGGAQITRLTLHGEAEVKSKPNTAMLQVGVEIRRPTGAEAMKAQAEQTTKIVEALKAQGVKEEDMQTIDLSLQPDINYGKGPRLRGYIATNFIAVTFRDLAKLGENLDAITKVGGLVERQLVFDVDQKGGALNEAREAAVKDAMARAEVYAKAMGYKVKRVLTVAEPGAGQQPPYPMYAPQLQFERDQAATPVMAGQLTTQASVDVTFELEKTAAP